MLTLLRKTTFFIFATSAAKVMPLIIGYFIAAQSGPVNYALYISFILLSGVITSFSALGCAPQALSMSDVKSDPAFCFAHLLLVGFFSVFLVSITLFILIETGFVSMPSDFSKIIHFSIIYSFGMFLIYLVTARLNNLGKHDWASIVWLVYSLIILCASSLWYFLNLDKKIIFMLIACSSLSAGIFGCYLLSAVGGDELIKYEAFRDYSVLSSIFKKAIQLSLFGLLITGVFFYLQITISSKSQNEGAVFSFFYQMFALIIFIPSVMGSFVVPFMVKQRLDGVYIYISYFLFSGIACLVFYILYPYVSELYNLPIVDEVSNKLFVFCLFSILASINACSNQIFVARKEYSLLLVFSFLWVFFIFVYLFIVGMNLGSILRALFYAYLIIVFSSFFLIKRKGYV